jgi:hypothetical protein
LQDQVGGTGDPQGQERRFGRLDEFGDPDPGGQGPDGLAAGDAGRGGDAAAAAAGEGVADRESGVGAGDADDHGRHPEEGQELGEHAGRS